MALLRLQLLGGFAAGGDGAPVDGSAPLDHFATDKVRALLAYLAVESNQPQRRSHLATLLWADWDERSALSNLRKSLFRLRHALEEITPGSADQLLESARSTIHFRAELANVDVLRFQSLLRLSDEHDHTTVATCAECRQRLIEATKLYQGDLLAGLALSGAQPLEEWLTIRQERLHRQAIETLEYLAVGLQAEGELEAAIDYTARQLALEPWRESAHRRLMILFATLGQQELALRQYDKCRLILDEELGVLPSTETDQLLDEIKAGRTSLAGGQTTTRATLHGFPAQVTTFLGRDDDVKAVLDRIGSSEVRLLTLTGLGGSGKTSLALAALNQLATDASLPEGGGWFISSAGITDPAVLTTAIGTQLGISFTTGSAPAEQVISFLRQRPILLVLDNYEQLLPHTTLVEQILTEAPTAQLIVTSRVPLNLRAEWRFPVSGLAVPDESATTDTLRAFESVRLLETIGRQIDPDFSITAENADAIGRICRRLDGIPLALEIASNWLQIYTPDVLADQLDQGLDSLVATRRDTPERHRSLQIVFDHSWAMLSSAEQTTLAKLACFQGNFSLSSARAVAGASVGELTTLLDSALLRRQASGRYSLHPVLREFAGAKSTSADDAYREHARWFLRLVADTTNLFGTHEASIAMAQIDQDVDDIREAWSWAVAARRLDWLEDALDGLAAYYQYKGHYVEGRTAFKTASTVADQGEVAASLVSRLHLAEALFAQKLGDLESALQLARAVRQTGDDTTLTAALLIISQLHELQSDYDAAVEALELAMDRIRQDRDQAGLARALNQLGVLHRQRNDYDQAIAAYEQALAINRTLGNTLAGSENHAGLGLLHKDRGEFDAAIHHLEQAQAMAESANHRENTARFTQNLGLVYWQMERLDEALVCYQQALTIAEEIQHSRGMAHCLGTIGVMHRRRHQYDAALDHYQRSLALFEQLGDRANTALVLGNIGNVFIDTGRFQQALDYQQRALAIDRELGVIEGVSRHLGNIGDIHKDQGQYAAAQAFYEESIPILRRTGGRYYLAWQLVAYAETMLAQDHLAEARALVEEGSQIAEGVGRRQDKFHAAILSARLAAAETDHDAALALLISMHAHYDLPEEQAEIAYTHWTLTGDPQARATAVSLFEPLAAQTGVFRYRHRLEQLVGSNNESQVN